MHFTNRSGGTLLALLVATAACGSAQTTPEKNKARNGGTGGTAGSATGGGGSSGASGSGNSGAPPHMVRPCAGGENGVGEPGTWEEITPPGVSLDPNFPTPAGMNYGIHQFVMDPSDTATIYVGTSAQGIFKTTDCGSTWTHINTGRNANLLDQGRNWAMIVDPYEPNVVYSNAGYGPNGFFKSTNGGVDWDQVLTENVTSVSPIGGFVQKATMDPTNHLHLLVSFHGQCSGQFTDRGCLAETLDGGTTWNVIPSAEVWSEGDGQHMIDSRTWLFGSSFGGVWRTTNAGMAWSKVYEGNASNVVYQSEMSGNIYFAGLSGVLRSTDDGQSWEPMMGSRSTSITGVADRLFASYGPCYNSDQPYLPYLTASETDGVWGTLESPMMYQGGGVQYDADHELLYSNNCVGGFWRAYILP